MLDDEAPNDGVPEAELLVPDTIVSQAFQDQSGSESDNEVQNFPELTLPSNSNDDEKIGKTESRWSRYRGSLRSYEQFLTLHYR